MDKTTIMVTRVLRGRRITRQVPLDGCLEAPEAAALLGIGLRHLYRLLEDAALPKCKRHGRVLIPCRAVIKRMEGGENNYGYKTRVGGTISGFGECHRRGKEYLR